MNLAALRGIVFDLDGTLYDQRPLQLRMLAEMAAAVATGAAGVQDVRIVVRFRRHRERLAELDPADFRARQYDDVAAILGVTPDRVREVIVEWMHRRPLRHLRACGFPGVAELFDTLRARGAGIAVLSDYPAVDKLAALGLAADCVVSAEDADIGRPKPSPVGLRAALARLGIAPSDALLIGDRDERDGACARSAGVAFLRKTRAGLEGPGGRFASYRELACRLADSPLPTATPGRPSISAVTAP